MRARSRVLLGLVAVALVVFGVVADRALVENARAAERTDRADLDQRARLTALALRATLGRIEERLLAGALPPGVTTSHAALGSPAPASSRSYAAYARADLERLLDSVAHTGNGLPESVVAAIALQTDAARSHVAERLLSGLLPIRLEDVPYLTRVLDAASDPRVATLTNRLAREADRPPPAAPSFGRRRAFDGRIEGWTRTAIGVLAYEVPAATLLTLGEVGDRVSTSSLSDGRPGVPVPDVHDLAVSVIPDGWARIRVRSMRASLWIAIVLALGAVITIVRAVERESRTVAREKALLANITHELRSPLASIRVLAETLAQGRGNPVEYGTLVAEEGQRLEGLVEQALTAARIDEAPSFAPVDPREIVSSAVALIRARAAKRSVSIDCRLPSLPEACWDGPAVRRAVLNLLDNAVTHGRAGGQVAVSATVADEALHVAIADDGPGIARRNRRRVFERFVCGSSDSPGTGLGLYVVEQVARAHGGRIDLVSAEHRGCTFTLVLPLGAGRAHASKAFIGSVADGRL